jgi:hypothetical protein
MIKDISSITTNSAANYIINFAENSSINSAKYSSQLSETSSENWLGKASFESCLRFVKSYAAMRHCSVWMPEGSLRYDRVYFLGLLYTQGHLANLLYLSVWNAVQIILMFDLKHRLNHQHCFKFWHLVFSWLGFSSFFSFYIFDQFLRKLSYLSSFLHGLQPTKQYL